MPITPDTKNWTWVLERACPECGFDANALTWSELPALLRREGNAWPLVLQRASAAQRPNDSTWSALEYAAHVRDVIRLGEYRTTLMLTEHDPLFANWDQDETAVTERYNEQNPDAVSADLVQAAESFAAALEQLTGDELLRSGRRSDGARFTVDSFARYCLHDVVHHGWDVRAG